MKKLFKIGCLGIISLFILGILINAFTGEDDGSTPANSQEKKSTSKVEKEKEYLIGQELQVGNVVFKVNEVSRTNEIKENDFLVYKPSADESEFYLVNLTVKNTGKEGITTDSSFFKLIKGDTEFSPSTILATSEKFFLYDGINPGLSQTGNVLFEIPKGEDGFILNVQTGAFGTEQGKINLK